MGSQREFQDSRYVFSDSPPFLSLFDSSLLASTKHHVFFHPNAMLLYRHPLYPPPSFILSNHRKPNRHGTSNPKRRDPLDDLLDFPRRRALAIRGRADRRFTVRPRRAGQLVRQGLRHPRTRGPHGVLEDQRRHRRGEAALVQCRALES